MPDVDPTLERLQGAMKFSLLMWAMYWPLGGLVLVAAGMRDPVSLAVVAVCVATLAVLVATGALRRTAMQRAVCMAVERPVYLMAAVVGAVLLGAFAEPVANLGLLAFSACYVGSLAMVALRLRQHLRATGQGLIQSRGDQLMLLIVLTILVSLPLVADMVLQAVGGGSVGSPSAAVAITNLVSLAYPPMLMLAARPFRAPLQVPEAVRNLVAPQPATAAFDGTPAPRRLTVVGRRTASPPAASAAAAAPVASADES